MGLNVIISLDARPLVTRRISGVEQRARNIVGQWAAWKLEHRFNLVLAESALDNPDYDTTFVQALPPTFHLQVIRHHLRFRPSAHRRPLIATGYGPPPDSIHCDIFHSFSGELPRHTPAPMVHTIHDLACELDPHVRATPEGRRNRRLYRQGIGRSSYTITVSNQTRDDIMSIYQLPRQRVRVVYNGVNPVFTPQTDPDAGEERLRRHNIPAGRYVLLVGSDIPRRNYQRIWTAMKSVWQTQPKLLLVFAGRDLWPRTAIYQRVQADGLQERTRFVESPTDEELARLYRGALLTCCGSSFEGFGLSVLEAMACGCCVACSDMRSLRALAGDAVLYFPHDDPEAMRDAILDLAGDPEFRRQLRRRGLKRVPRYGWDRSAKKLLRILEHAAEIEPSRGAAEQL